MAKALFHKSQRVYVKPVGTWALVERVIPHWVKNVDEPLRVTYDVGLGREFQSAELISEQAMRGHGAGSSADDDIVLENWRIVRALNRWQPEAQSTHHPHPGTYPIIVTDDEADWGGWRVPAAEYDRDPQKIEHQARMIVNASDMVRLLKQFVEHASKQGADLDETLRPIARRSMMVLRHVYDVPEELPADLPAATPSPAAKEQPAKHVAQNVRRNPQVAARGRG